MMLKGEAIWKVTLQVYLCLQGLTNLNRNDGKHTLSDDFHSYRLRRRTYSGWRLERMNSRRTVTLGP